MVHTVTTSRVPVPEAWPDPGPQATCPTPLVGAEVLSDQERVAHGFFTPGGRTQIVGEKKCARTFVWGKDRAPGSGFEFGSEMALSPPNPPHVIMASSGTSMGMERERRLPWLVSQISRSET